MRSFGSNLTPLAIRVGLFALLATWLAWRPPARLLREATLNPTLNAYLRFLRIESPSQAHVVVGGREPNPQARPCSYLSSLVPKHL